MHRHLVLSSTLVLASELLLVVEQLLLVLLEHLLLQDHLLVDQLLIFRCPSSLSVSANKLLLNWDTALNWNCLSHLLWNGNLLHWYLLDKHLLLDLRYVM